MKFITMLLAVLTLCIFSGCVSSTTLGGFDWKAESKPAGVWSVGVKVEQATFDGMFDTQEWIDSTFDTVGRIVSGVTELFAPPTPAIPDTG